MDIQDKLKLNLQFFAEDPDDRTNPDDKQGGTDQDDPKKDDKKDGDDKKNDYVTVEELQRRLKQKDKEKENAVKEAITNVINDIAKKKIQESLRTGAPKNVKSGGMTREDIMNIKDSEERQMAIVQNRHLFK